jgi:OFA family oxalate/formate antiporter-like MFS transporter
MERWRVLVAGVLLQLVLGGIYAWSVFVPHLGTEHGLGRGECGLVFGVMIAVFTLAMIPAGRLLKRAGPRVTAGTGAVLFGAGYLVASFSGGSFPVLLVGLGLVTGTGIGFGYVCPLTVGMKWFPRNRGLVTGVAVAGFGGGAILLGFLAEILMLEQHWPVLAVFRAVGLGLGALAILGAMGLSEPPEAEAQRRVVREGPLRPHLLSGTFGLIALGMFAGTFAGLLTVGNLSPLLLGKGLSESLATLGVTLFAVGNAAGRILWGQVHDRLGSRRTVLASLAFLGLALLPLWADLPPGAALGVVLLAGAGFGACFVVYASSVVEYFGLDLFPRLYPVCFLGYGLAGLAGPGAGGWIRDASGSYASAVLLSVAIVGIALAWIGVALPDPSAEKIPAPDPS